MAWNSPDGNPAMETIFFVGCNPKEQFRLKNFLAGSYEVKANPSVHNSVETIHQTRFDLLVYNAENAIPLSYFLQEIGPPETRPRVSVLTGSKDLKAIRDLQELGMASIIPKPYNKASLLRGVREALAATTDSQPDVAESKTTYAIKQSNTEVLIALRKNAVISKIAKGRIVFLLPAALTLGTRLLFRNLELFRIIGLRSEVPPHLEISVVSCRKISDFQFEVEAEFSDDKWLVFQKTFDAYVTQNASVPSVPSISKTILHAEADAVTRDFFRRSLEERGYNFLMAQDGFEALEKLENGAVDLLLIDLLLPKLTGNEVIEVIKKRKNSIPILVATGETSPEVIRKIRPLVRGILFKPIGGDFLVGCVAEVIGGQQEGGAAPPRGNGEYVEVNLATDLTVAFRDRVKLLNIGPGGLTFTRGAPIAPGTIILVKTAAISVFEKDKESRVDSFELKVAQCDPQKDERTYLVYAEFSSEQSGAA